MILYYSSLLDIKTLCTKPKCYTYVNKGKKNAVKYVRYYCGFDIETTNIINSTDKMAFMYHWQFALNNHTIMGRTWSEFIEFITRLEKHLKLNKHLRLIVWIANEGFEFQFMRRHLKVTEIFARKKREPLLVVHNNSIEFRDCLAISGGSLKYLAKNYCTTQKLNGDLDFSILRNSTTELDETEKQYCINDVRILAEWSEYIFATYIDEGWLPLTRTGILRHKVKENVNDEIRGFVRRAFPSQELYNVMMKYLFRGGFTHANMFHVKQLYRGEEINGFDFTSSYPAVMNHCVFPMSKLKRIPDIKTENDLKRIPSKCPYFIAVRFYNIESTTYHSIESKFKCVRLEGEYYENGQCVGTPLIDNGRVSKAGIMSVFITNVDYEIYKMFYTWDKMEIEHCYYSAGGKLPPYLIDVLNSEYEKKAKLKKAGLENSIEYLLAKQNVNSAYGMTVTKMYTDEIYYTPDRLNEKNELDEWHSEETEKSWYTLVKNMFLLPQWGIWVTAWARYNLLKTVNKIEQESPEGGDVIYCDTDSIYLLNYRKHQHIIDDYNHNIHELNSKLFPNKPEFLDLGEFDKINKKTDYYEFKTLGAKRYIKSDKLCVNNRFYEKRGKVHVTVAGLPTNSLQKYCDEKNKDIFDTFNDGMELDTLYSMKNAHHYNDKPTQYVVNGELMAELSSVCIYPITFKLTLAPIYLSLLKEIQERRKEVEKY